MITLLAEVLEAATRHRTRAVATAFGVFWGIFMLTLLLGAGRGLRNGLYGMYEGISVNALWIYSGRTTQAFEGLGEGREISLDIDDVKSIAQAVPEIQDLTPRPMLPAVVVRHGSRSASLPAFGVYPSFGRIERMRALRGRLLNELDLAEARRVVMIGDKARLVLFGAADPVGQEVQVGGVTMTVVGEYYDPGPETERRHIYIPFTTLQRSFNGSAKVELVIGNLREGAATEGADRRIRKLLARRHRFDADDKAALEVWFLAEEFKRLKKLMFGIDAAIAAVGLGSLISGMVGISNILFVSVRERTREFGIRRALGATARSILGMVIAEALLLGMVAGGVGLCAGLGLVHMVQSMELQTDFFRQPQVDTDAALIALSVLVATALIAGFFPAREAARIAPIDALRAE